MSRKSIIANQSQDVKNSWHTPPIFYPFIKIEFTDTWFDTMTENIAKDKNKHSKAGIALVAVILGGPFVYLGLILIVLYNPAVMKWLGLEHFVAYLIELQPAGYENLVRLNSPAFADYFFHFHAATVLISIIFVIAILICSRASFMNHKSHERLKKLLQEKKVIETSRGKVKVTPARVALYSLLLGGGGLYANLTWPYWAGSGKFYVGDGGMSIFVVLTMLNMMLILAMVMTLHLLISFHYWPKLRSWLVNKRKPNQQIKHRVKQHYRED